MHNEYEAQPFRPGPVPGELTAELVRRHRAQLLVAIVDRSKNKRVTEILQHKHVHLHYVLLAEGTASSEVMDLLGLGSIDKAVTLCIAPQSFTPALLAALDEGLGLAGAGKGIAFTVPLSGVSSSVFQLLDKEMQERVHGIQQQMEKEVEKMSVGASHDLILALINQGCSEDLMAAAKTAGATGGTVIHARRIGAEESAKFFGIAIQAEKEVVAILTSRDKKKEIMKAIGRSCGMKSEAKGLCISLPVDDIVGLAGAFAEPELSETAE